MHVIDMQPGDAIVSRKYVAPYQLVHRYFNNEVRKFSIKEFGENVVFPEANHVRIVVGKVEDVVWAFHWTYPRARFCRVHEWMLDPSYSMSFRYTFGDTTTCDAMELALSHEGDAYDVGELLDMKFSFKRFFDFGKHHHVCSSGVFMMQQKLLGLDIPIETEKCPPCMWANYPDLFFHLNPANPGSGDKRIGSPVLHEPRH